MLIRDAQLATPFLLAPIARYCDLAFRTICREQGGVGLACTDLLSPQGLLRGTATSLDLAQTNDFDKPVGMQLYGSDPAIMAEGARWAEGHGATIIDINMGCPVDKVTKKDGGSKLMCDPCRAESIVEAVARAVRVPVTTKMRLGWSEADAARNAAGDLALRVIDAGACAVTIHGRTTEQRFGGQARLDRIRAAVDLVRARHGTRVPIIGNGDVTSVEAAQRMMRETGCDGVMIGRGALSTPWIFRDCAAAWRGEPVPPEPTDEQKIAIIRRFFDLMRAYRGDQHAMHQVRSRISWFGKKINGGRCGRLKEGVRGAAVPGDVYAVLDRWLDADLRAGEATDEIGSTLVQTSDGC